MVFLDAGAIIAYFYGDDPFNAAASAGFKKLGASGRMAFTTSLCLAEFADVYSFNTKDYARAARALREVLSWGVHIVRPSVQDERRALDLMETYAQKRVSFTDCVSFVAMDARQSDTAFTFDDEHFVKLRKPKPWVPIPRGKTPRGR